MINYKHAFSSAAVILFLYLAVASSPSSQLQLGHFNSNNFVEENGKGEVYVVKNDGTKVYGKKVDYQYGIAVKNQVQLDDQKFNTSEVRGFMDGRTYFTRLDGAEFVQRIVHGKINVYVQTYHAQSNNPHLLRGNYYAQIGEKGSLKKLDKVGDITDLVASCPLSVQMVDDAKSLGKAVKADKNYLNKVFEIYNNNCKPVK